jgi:hypothetical protein
MIDKYKLYPKSATPAIVVNNTTKNGGKTMASRWISLSNVKFRLDK